MAEEAEKVYGREAEKRAFVTVGTTAFDELVRAATEETFLKVLGGAECYLLTQYFVFKT